MNRLLALLAFLFLAAFSTPASAWYLCAPSTPPAWPNHGWCQWQPSGNGTPVPIVQPCQAGGPTWGFVHLYADDACGATMCAAVPVGAQGADGVYRTIANYNFVELNGWFAIAPGILTTIRSIKVGPGVASWGGTYTSVLLSSGPDPTPPVVDIYPQCTLQNFSGAASPCRRLVDVCPSGFGLASFAMSAK